MGVTAGCRAIHSNWQRSLRNGTNFSAATAEAGIIKLKSVSVQTGEMKYGNPLGQIHG
jgi:hypothetical protein